MAADSRRLQDVLMRHQAYLEGVKAYYALNFSRTLQVLIIELRKLFGRIEFDTLDALTKAQLNAFVRQVRELQKTHYDKFIVQLLEELEAFMLADLDITKILFSSFARSNNEDETNVETLLDEFDDVLDEDGNDDNALVSPILISGTEDGNDRLWKLAKNSPIPASGLALIGFLSSFASSASNTVLQAILRGYANRAAVQATLKEIVGSKSGNFRDGLLTRVNAQGAAVVDSSLQHVDAIVQSAVASLFYNKYQWISVIDGATTEICRGRNRKIYEYGKGPLPPAHINCRSKTVPYVGIDEGLKTYGAWILAQPSKIRKDLGEEKLSVSRLSLSQFRAKLSLMLLEDDDEA